MIFKVQLLVFLGVGVLGKNIFQHEKEPLNLTPLVKKGQTEAARKLSAVNPTLFAGVKSHAGLFTVNKIKKWNQFFWFFPAPGKPLETTPWLIWLQGGPGVSSMFGLFEEIGPLKIVNGSAQKMPVTWASEYSLLFIDNPAGVGFSDAEEEYPSNEDHVGASLLSLIQQFLQVFPELRKAPLFLTGESYAGKYIPAFAHYIHHKNDSLPINLKGLAIGNGWTDPISMLHYSEFALQIGLIDPLQAEKIKKFEIKARKYCGLGRFEVCHRYYDQVYELLDQFSNVDFYNYLKIDKPLEIEDMPMSEFLSRADVRAALHVGELEFRADNWALYQSFHDDLYRSTKPWLEEMIEHYGVMCYSGQLDVIVAYALSVRTYHSLVWSDAQAYRAAKRTPIENKKSEIIGFAKGAGNFMEVMVRGAGHMVPTDQPEAALQVLKMFVNKFAK